VQKGDKDVLSVGVMIDTIRRMEEVMRCHKIKERNTMRGRQVLHVLGSLPPQSLDKGR